MANETKQVYGSVATVISKSATLADAANTLDADATELDNSLNYPMALAVFENLDTFAAAPDAGSTIDLFMTKSEIDGTDDELPAPAATDIENRAHYVGSFRIDDADVVHQKQIEFPLAGVKKAKFFIRNNSGQTLSYSTNAITVKVTPFSYAPT